MATDPNKMLEMSDEDIMAMSEPPAEATAPAVVPPADGAAEPDPSGSAEGEKPAAVIPAADPDPSLTPPIEKVEEGAESKADQFIGADGKPIVQAPEGEAPKPAEAKPGEAPAEKKPGEGEAAPGGDKPAGQQRVFQVPTSFKANGKTIELKDEAEALSLMQMGANYTRKLQELQPNKKLLLMLEKNGLLDEGKLSFLIDVDKKDPEAIKKLLKDTGIDPLEIDTSTEPAYLAGNHQVGDDEVNFRTTLDELSSNPEGAKTLTEINTTWDQASKEVLWQSPEVMTIINEQRSAGVYDVIKAEVDRQTTLGRIPPNTPFIQAYKTIGDAMAQAALGGGGNGEQAPGASVPGQAQPQVLGTRVAAPKSTVTNDDKAKAASPTRSTPGTAKPLVNPLAESDEAFMKRMENRL